MATGKALVCKLKNIEPIPEADKIVQANMFGEIVIITKDYKEGDLGLLFDTECQLSHEFASNNNLYRHSNLNKNTEIVGYLEDNRRVKPIRLKGVKCSALFLPIKSIDFALDDLDQYPKEGEEIDFVEDIQICQKYITKKTRQAKQNKQGKIRLIDKLPVFKHHVETNQLMRNLHKIGANNILIITEKIHGTSAIGSHTLVYRNKSIFEKIINKIGIKTPETKYEFVTSSRRVVKQIGDVQHTGSGYYNSDIWTISAEEKFKGKLRKGETVYYEIVGYLPDGTTIMPSQSNEKLKNFMDKKEYKEFIKKYGSVTEFSYDCNKPNYEIYVYRITMTNEDGDSIDYSWDQVKNRCEEMAVKHVPELGKYIVSKWTKDGKEYLAVDYGEELEEFFQKETEKISEIFKKQIKEGIVVRVENGGMTPIFLKNKKYFFKILEEIIKDSDIVDLEESQS